MNVNLDVAINNMAFVEYMTTNEKENGKSGLYLNGEQSTFCQNGEIVLDFPENTPPSVKCC